MPQTSNVLRHASSVDVKIGSGIIASTGSGRRLSRTVARIGRRKSAASKDSSVLQLVAALDLAVMVPALTMGGILLWRRHPWGYVLASIASIQGAMYLLVLSVNSMVAIRRGLVAAPGELPIWGSLMVLTTVVAVAVLASVRPEGAGPSDRRLPSIQSRA
jgi:hypothetical protein